MKSTYVGVLPRPELRGSYVSFTVTVPLPTSGIAKDLPPLPAGHVERWELLVTAKQWRRVEAAFRADPQEKAVAEGIAVCTPGELRLWVTALKAISLEKQRQAAQQAATGA